MAKPMVIELVSGAAIPILYEDRVVLGVDKPAGWMLAPDDWDRTQRNLQRALVSSINAGELWAKSRGIKFIRFVHRLDAETSGVLLLAKTPGALSVLGELFETRKVEKKYLAVVEGIPAREKWICSEKIGTEPRTHGRMKVDAVNGKDAETEFTVLKVGHDRALVEARPLTGRMHQIRVHLAASSTPVVGDVLYGKMRAGERAPMALRAIELSYPDPFQRKQVLIQAPADGFLKQFGFAK
jgi:23S rRNA pseudouridine1911/1915/1917 synthase